MSTLEELFAAARADVDSGAVPACQLAVGHGGDIVGFETFGAATPATRFCVFSATKPFVAAAMWLLVADGRIDVSRRASDYTPALAESALRDVTVEQVMLHTSGFPHATMDERAGSDPQRRAATLATWQLEWEPGSRFEYHAGSAHWVLVELIERVTGRDFREFIAAEVCAPLGIPRVLGIEPAEQTDIAELVAVDPDAESDDTLRFNRPHVRAAGVPGGGAFMTAADMARFYQGLLHNPGQRIDPAVLHDATTNIRCTFPDPLMGAPVNRTLGLVLAGDDGLHILRYAIFGQHCSPGSFGHAGAHAQVGWADPATGISFAYFTNAVGSDQMVAGIRSNRLATIASELQL